MLHFLVKERDWLWNCWGWEIRRNNFFLFFLMRLTSITTAFQISNVPALCSCVELLSYMMLVCLASISSGSDRNARNAMCNSIILLCKSQIICSEVTEMFWPCFGKNVIISTFEVVWKKYKCNIVESLFRIAAD